MAADGRLTVQVKTAKRRSAASTAWLKRQLNDDYVHAAKAQGFRARSVFKLKEIDERFRLIRRGSRVIDLGAAPGSWAQYATGRGAEVVGVDLLPVAPIKDATIIEGDFLEPEIQDRITAALGGPADLVLSDIAASSTGQRAVDRLRAEGMGEAVLDFASRALRPDGTCLLKLVKGAEAALVPLAQRHFTGYRLLRPKATRSDSSEIYLLATGRREAAGGDEPAP
jgi:23S rRNA (uridine2552-2'-O)-methyltransferase